MFSVELQTVRCWVYSKPTPLQQNIHLLLFCSTSTSTHLPDNQDGKAVCKMTLVMTKQFYLHRIDFKVASHVTSLSKLTLRVYFSDESITKSLDSIGPESRGIVQGVILGENVVGSADDVEIPPPLTKTEQELLNNCLYPSANLGAPSEAVQLVCVDMPNVCNGELNEEVISVKKEEEY